MKVRRSDRIARTLMAVALTALGSCSSDNTTSGGTSGAAVPSVTQTPASAGGNATVTGTTPAPFGVVLLSPENPGAESAAPDAPAAGTPGDDPPRMDQNAQTFIPDILTARTGQPVMFSNSDGEMHNINVKNLETREQAFNVAIPIGESYSFKFAQDGFYDVRCDIHPAMTATIVMSSSPYVTISDAHGNFSIKEVPPGPYRLTLYTTKGPIARPVVVSSPTTAVNLDASDGS